MIYEVREGSEELASDLASLRKTSWLKKHPQYAEKVAVWNDHHDLTSIHILAKDAEKIIGAARVTIAEYASQIPAIVSYSGINNCIRGSSYPIAVFMRLVVHPEYRGLGIARQLDLERLAHTKKVGIDVCVIETHANSGRVEGLKELGFYVASGEVSYPVLPHETLPSPIESLPTACLIHKS